MLHRGSRNLPYDSCLGRRMKTGLQDKASSPGSPASTDGEFAAALAAQLAAQAERFHKASPANADDDFAKSLAAKLAARSERLRAAASSTPPPSSQADFSAPGIDPRVATDRFFSLLASIRVGHIWVGFLLLMLLAGAAVLAVWGLPFPPSEPLPSSHIEQAKAAVPRADAMSGNSPTAGLRTSDLSTPSLALFTHNVGTAASIIGTPNTARCAGKIGAAEGGRNSGITRQAQGFGL